MLLCVQLPPGGGAFQEELVVRQVMRRVVAGETRKGRGAVVLLCIMLCRRCRQTLTVHLPFIALPGVQRL